MERYIEFVMKHWELAVAFAAVLGLLLWTEKRKGGPSLSTQQATMLINKEDAVVVDVRPRKEFESGHIVNSINIPAADFDKRADELNKHKDKPIIVVCAMGQSAGASAKTLQTRGFARVMKLSGGIAEWKGANLPVVR
ncbi:rhodanese-like domain-containing protein [Pokkaliibacter sp. MBI-7]|uniref:rhodanese-like domain-containing protein n=1 Tax=Pokkaliibacter sp. MBI-7 TaxID=3040600 RepID=UPI00244BD124|nr:rhodanese-like domain-containing protein [Pokkaliibacter sp. MBI-7]MDH2432865.1 rhodanese-like domain-containing protein [Pokkaliibacter sp. MBI-7]